MATERDLSKEGHLAGALNADPKSLRCQKTCIAVRLILSPYVGMLLCRVLLAIWGFHRVAWKLQFQAQCSELWGVGSVGSWGIKPPKPLNHL